MDHTIFRAYDIRGVYPDNIDSDVATLIGLGVGTLLRNNIELPSIVTGRDARIHSPELHSAFINGLKRTGCRVIDIGLSPSPILYFANTIGDFDAGCNVTASHNPKQYNGFKITSKKADVACGSKLQKIYQIIEKGDFATGEGSVEEENFFDQYLQKITSIFSFSRKLKIVVDTGNGVAGAFYPKILTNFGHEVIELFTELDGNFPNHAPDPSVEDNLTDLKEKVLEVKADIGLSFDGDGDRVGIITEKGEYINADQTLMLLTQDVLKRHPGSAVVFTISNSQLLFDLTKKWGGKPVMSKVGHSFVEMAMKEHNAILGGEQSGHYFLPENYYSYDDALVAACRILMILSESTQPLSVLFSQFPLAYSAPEMRPHCPDMIKFDVMEKIKKHFMDQYPHNLLDGIRLDFGDGGWAVIRVSNTNPSLSIIIEAQSQDHFNQIKRIILGHLESYPEIEFK